MHGFLIMHAPWHSLDKTWSETVKRNSDLHVLVISEIVAVAKQHRLVMVPDS